MERCSHFLGQLHISDSLQSLEAVPQLAVQAQESDQAEVAEVLVEGVVAKLSRHGGGVLTRVVGFQLWEDWGRGK